MRAVYEGTSTVLGKSKLWDGQSGTGLKAALFVGSKLPGLQAENFGRRALKVARLYKVCVHAPLTRSRKIWVLWYVNHVQWKRKSVLNKGEVAVSMAYLRWMSCGSI